MIAPIFRPLLLAALLVLAFACGKKGKTGKAGDRLLASVYDNNLYLSETDGLFPEGTSKEDSVLILNAFRQRWVREQLLMYEAERNIPKDLDLDELVRDYRASLVRYNFEEKLILEKLDTVVPEAELQRYFEENKDQFNLESTILKCLLVKVPMDVSQTDFIKFWNAKNYERLALLAREKASVTLLNAQKWYKLEEIAALLPRGTLTADNASARREGTLNDDDFRYYYRVLEAVRGKETAPFDYARSQVANIILHKRKQALLEKWKEELYQKELRRGNIKIEN